MDVAGFFCSSAVCFPSASPAKSIKQAGRQAGGGCGGGQCGGLSGGADRGTGGGAVGLLNVGSGLQGGSTQTPLITAQMPLFIFRIVQLISAPVSEPLGKSDPLLPL